MATTANAEKLFVSKVSEKLDKKPSKIGIVVFLGLLVLGLGYVGIQLLSDLHGSPGTSIMPYVLLGLALLIALAFEFVNGFHDTANAVATVIYTHSLEPNIAVMWSGAWNFFGVLVSSGAVAFGIVSLLPVELILQVGSGAGFAMVFALLAAAIVWNLGTWWFGLPSSSSHTLIGSILGVGIMNQMMASHGSATSGVDWAQAGKVAESLLLSPLVGFVFAALLLVLCRKLIPDQRLYQAPEGNAPPPFWIRCLLLLTCTGVSFAHGSNDGQKGMGLIMLILIGTVPTAYALNHTVPASYTTDFVAYSEQAATTLGHYAAQPDFPGDSRAEVQAFVRDRTLTATTVPALEKLVGEIAHDLARYKDLKNVPTDQTRNFRNDLYLVSEAVQRVEKSETLKITKDDMDVLKNYKKHVDQATRFIPSWVKVAVAIALGLGTMVGWKRIVVTVGEKIGKDHLTYAQGASAEITAMVTIGAADAFGLPVSTTHVLSSGVAGTMMANRTGLQWETVRNLAMAWILTLPVSILLSGTFFWIFSKIG
ncbi:MAG TPA: inorganic phosphate transporter [Polyangiaceae bacterium]|nr:inorganic phosphate transporter [Polyangiaceae bacterium]